MVIKQKIARKIKRNGSQEMCLSARPNSGCPCAHQFLNHAGVFGQLILSKIPSDLPHPSPAHQQSTEPCCPAFAKYLKPPSTSFSRPGIWHFSLRGEYFDAMITCNTAAVTQPYFKIFKYLPRPKSFTHLPPVQRKTASLAEHPDCPVPLAPRPGWL